MSESKEESPDRVQSADDEVYELQQSVEKAGTNEEKATALIAGIGALVQIAANRAFQAGAHQQQLQGLRTVMDTLRNNTTRLAAVFAAQRAGEVRASVEVVAGERPHALAAEAVAGAQADTLPPVAQEPTQPSEQPPAPPVEPSQPEQAPAQPEQPQPEEKHEDDQPDYVPQEEESHEEKEQTQEQHQRQIPPAPEARRSRRH